MRFLLVLALMLSFSTAFAADEDFLIEGDTLCGYIGTDKEIKIPSGVHEIAERVFYMSDIISVEFPKSVETLGDYAFYGCRNLKKIEGFADYIGDYCFYNCNSLYSITRTDLTREIGKKAFFGCNSLTEFTFGENIASIDDYAFSGVPIKKALFPEALTEIGNGAFKNCTSLSSVSFKEGITKIDEEAFMNTGIRYLELPESVERIDRAAFKNCKNLSRASMNVYEIGSEAFMYDTNLVKAEHTNTLEEIGDYAFWGCTSLITSFGDKIKKGINAIPQREEEFDTPDCIRGNVLYPNGSTKFIR